MRDLSLLWACLQDSFMEGLIVTAYVCVLRIHYSRKKSLHNIVSNVLAKKNTLMIPGYEIVTK